MTIPEGVVWYERPGPATNMLLVNDAEVLLLKADKQWVLVFTDSEGAHQAR